MNNIIKVDFKKKNKTQKEKDLQYSRLILKNCIKQMANTALTPKEIALILAQHSNSVANTIGLTEIDKSKLRKEII